MCGIVGYVGRKNAVEVLLAGLKKLEYRGYDSCGIATVEENSLKIRKTINRIDGLAQKCRILLHITAVLGLFIEIRTKFFIRQVFTFARQTQFIKQVFRLQVIANNLAVFLDIHHIKRMQPVCVVDVSIFIDVL